MANGRATLKSGSQQKVQRAQAIPRLSLTDTELGFLRELDLCVGTLRVSIAVQVSPESLRGLVGLSPPLFYVWTLDYFFYSEVNQSTLPLLSYVAKVTGLASLFRFSS